MKNNKSAIKYLPGAVVTFILFTLSGCTGQHHVSLPATAQDGILLTADRLSAIEFQLYAGKQIQIFAAAINARLSSIAIGTTSIASEKIAASAAIRECSEALNEFRQVNPSLGMEDQKADIITCMESAITHMNQYLDAISTDEPTDQIKTCLTGDAIALTSLAEIYNQ